MSDGRKIFEQFEEQKDFLEEKINHGIEPRVHAIAYELLFPDWLADSSVKKIKPELERRYKEIAERDKDKIPTIEVTNEMDCEKGKTVFYEEPDFIEWCFKLAEKYFPGNQLVINEGHPMAFKNAKRTASQYYSYIEANLYTNMKFPLINLL